MVGEVELLTPDEAISVLAHAAWEAHVGGNSSALQNAEGIFPPRVWSTATEVGVVVDA